LKLPSVDVRRKNKNTATVKMPIACLIVDVSKESDERKMRKMRLVRREKR